MIQFFLLKFPCKRLRVDIDGYLSICSLKTFECSSDLITIIYNAVFSLSFPPPIDRRCCSLSVVRVQEVEQVARFRLLACGSDRTQKIIIGRKGRADSDF